MQTLDRLREREFLFVTAEARNKFKSILYALEMLRHIALAPNQNEPAHYRIAVHQLFNSLSDITTSLYDEESFRRPIIYTGLIDKIDAVTIIINFNQPESIFRMMNKLIVIKKEIEKLLEQLRN